MSGLASSSIDLISSLDAGNPLHLQTNDNSIGALVNVKLTGCENYRVWATAMKIALQAKNKMGFVDGTCVKSTYDTSVPLSNQWERCNVVVLSWLLSSISEDLYLSQVYSENAAKVWKELKDTYDKLDGSILKFDILTKFSPCTCNARTELGKHQQLMKLMQFLMGLDDVYQPIRSSLLTQPELPDVKDAFVIVCREESQRGLGSTSRVQKPQVSSFVARTVDNNQRGQNRNNNSFTNNNNGTNRTQCFEIIGYPPGFKKNPNGNFGNNNKRGFSNNNNMGGSSNNVEVQTPNGSLPFTNDQIKKLMSLIGEKENSGVQASMAGNMKLTNNVVLFDVLVIPEYTDLKKEYVLGTGSESGGLYMFDINCIVHQTSCAYTPQQNGIAERKHIISSYLARSLYFKEGPSDDAGEVIMDHQSTDTTEEQPFDDDVHIASSMDDNLISEGNVPCVQNVPTYNSSNRTDDDNPAYVNTRRSCRVSKLPDKLNDFVLDNKVKYGLNKYANHTKFSADNSCFISNLNKTAEPTCYDEDVKDINWVQAMNNEMEALYLNNTWILTNLPINRKAIRSKWVYKIKYKSDGEVERYKARDVAKGFGQKEGVDYEDIFSPVVKMSTVRCFISMAVQKSWNIFQIDVNNAFLYGGLTEDVYMIPPPGFFDENEKRVCKLVKSLYGLKQAPR
ncbi:ribonuclease H-like domain-containing protein [Tanacetum coccineum]